MAWRGIIPLVVASKLAEVLFAVDIVRLDVPRADARQ
jgi:hypothetical protein